jgi:hypothetical protein
MTELSCAPFNPTVLDGSTCADRILHALASLRGQMLPRKPPIRISPLYCKCIPISSEHRMQVRCFPVV